MQRSLHALAAIAAIVALGACGAKTEGGDPSTEDPTVNTPAAAPAATTTPAMATAPRRAARRPTWCRTAKR
jgi:hypothetical protein